MPATSKQIDAILKDKAVKFHSLYASESRRWFVDFVLDAEIKKGVTPAAATATCKQLVADILALLKDLNTWELRDPIKTEKPKHIETWNTRVVEIVYGVAAQAPTILTELTYLNFIVRRRLRTVVRMQGYVNDTNSSVERRGYVTYPGDCLKGDLRVSADGTARWTYPTPFEVKPPATPTEAISALYATAHPNKTPGTSSCTFGLPGGDHIELCKTNKFDCSHAVVSVSVDALLEAADPDTFLPAQASIAAPHYLSVRYPAPVAEPHIFWRPSATKPVFERIAMAAPQIDPASGTAGTTVRLDLQDGDHVYIRNVPLFREVAPDDVWQGEHSIVVKCGDRTFKSGNGFVFSGHGVTETTLIQMMQDFNDRLNTMLSRAATLGKLFLDAKRSPGALPSGLISISAATAVNVWNVDATARIQANSYVLTLSSVEYDEYDDLGSTSPTPKKVKYPFTKIWVLENPLPPLQEFAFAPVGDPNAAIDRGFRRDACVRFRKTGTPGPGQSLYERSLWTIPHKDENGTETEFPIFSRAGNAPIFELKDMPIQPFKRLNPLDTRIVVIRPVVDMTSSYVAALKTDQAF